MHFKYFFYPAWSFHVKVEYRQQKHSNKSQNLTDGLKKSNIPGACKITVFPSFFIGKLLNTGLYLVPTHHSSSFYSAHIFEHGV